MTNEELERFQALENEVKTLRENNRRNLLEQAQSSLIEKYRLDERYDLPLEVTFDHVQVADSDLLQEVVVKFDKELKRVCERCNIEKPGTPSDAAKDFIKRRNDALAQEARDAEELKKHML